MSQRLPSLLLGGCKPRVGGMSALENYWDPLLISRGIRLIFKTQTKAIQHYQNTPPTYHSELSLTILVPGLRILQHYVDASIMTDSQSLISPNLHLLITCALYSPLHNSIL